MSAIHQSHRQPALTCVGLVMGFVVQGCSSSASGPPAGRCGDGVVAPGQLCFAESEYEIGGTLLIRAGDVDGDGHADVAGLEDVTPAMFVMRGDGHGNLATPERHPIESAGELAVCDVNGDGVDEVIVLERWPGELVIFRADGALAETSRMFVGNAGHRLACADMDHDGRGDLVIGVGFGGDQTIRIAYGQADATLSEPFSISTPRPLRAVAVADIDRDGDLDIVGAEDEGVDAVVTVLNEGGTFELSTPAAAGACVHALATGQLDGDDQLDVVTADTGSDGITVLTGAGDGSFVGSRAVTLGLGNLGCHFGPEDLLVADLDRDGSDDVALVHRLGHSLVILSQTQSGVRPVASYPVAEYPISLAGADLNEDGFVDLIVSSPEGAPDDQGFLAHDHEGGRLSVFVSDP